MIGQNNLERIAIFLICIIITLPFYSASVFAQSASLKLVSVQGEDGFGSATYTLAKSVDVVSVNVEAVISDDPSIDNQQVWFFLDGSPQGPASCSGNTCSYSQGYDTTKDTLAFEARLYDDNSTVADTPLVQGIYAKVYIDSTAPRAITFSPAAGQLVGGISGTGLVKFNYEVKDDGNTPGKCAGLSSIEVRSGSASGTLEASIPVETEGSCSQSGEIDVDMGSTKRDVTLYLLGTDRFGQKSSSSLAKSYSLKVDATAPAISNDLIFMDGDDEVEAISGETTMTAVICVNSLKMPLSVKVDLAGLDYERTTPRTVTATRGSFNQDLGCTEYRVSNANVNMQSSGSVSVDINATDKTGVSRTGTASMQLVFDDQPPTISAFSTNHQYDGKSWIGGETSENIISFTMSDPGVGVSEYKMKNEVRLSPVFINLAGTGVVNGTGDESAYTLRYEGYYSTSGEGVKGKVEIQGVQDILLNKVVPSPKFNVSVDAFAPRIKSYNLSHTGVEHLDYPVAGNSVTVVFNMTEGTAFDSTRVYANMSLLGSGNGRVQGQCQMIGNESDDYICQFNAEVTETEYTTGKLYFNFTDIAGNYNEKIIDYEVYEAVVEAVDIWDVSVFTDTTCSPNLISRRVASIGNLRRSCMINLDVNEGFKAAEVLEYSLGQCVLVSPEGETLSTYIRNVELLNPIYNQTDLYFLTTLAQTEFDVNNLTYQCPLSMISQYQKQQGQGFLTATPEIENVTFTVNFYDFPLGELAPNVKGDAKKYYERSQTGIWETISSIKEIIRVSQKICKILGLVYELVAAYQVTEAILGGAVNAAPDATSKGLLKVVHLGTCGSFEVTSAASDSMFTYADHFCSFVNCKLTKGSLGEGKIASTIAFFGGGGGFASTDTFEKWQEMSQKLTGKPLTGYVNFFDNIVWSTLTLCLPGIVSYLERYRQLMCLRADCYMSTPDTSLPTHACDAEFEYGVCKYVVGDFFYAFPPTAFVNQIISMIRGAISDPMGVLAIGMTLGCKYLCADPEGLAHKVCSWGIIFDKLGKVTQEVMAAADSEQGGYFDSPTTDYCAELDASVFESDSTDDDETDTDTDDSMSGAIPSGADAGDTTTDTDTTDTDAGDATS